MQKELKRIISLSFIILTLNLIWEFSHYSLYINLSGISLVPHLILASFTDLLIILGIFVVISLKNKSLDWINNPKRLDYFIIILFGLLIASTIELNALRIGRWAYTTLMPTILNIGITPLIQLFTTALISIYINRRFNKHL